MDYFSVQIRVRGVREGPGWGWGSWLWVWMMILSGWKQDQSKLVDMRQQILKPVAGACLTRGHFTTDAVDSGTRTLQLNLATVLVTTQRVCTCVFRTVYYSTVSRIQPKTVVFSNWSLP